MRDDTAPREAVDAVRADFVAAMRNVAATVTIVTAAGPTTGPAGLTATAVCSLSVDPPTLLVCVGRDSMLAAALTESRAFAVNVLGPHGEPLARHFAGEHGIRGGDRFAAGVWDASGEAPVLADALASFVCRLEALDAHGTHLVAIGTVVQVAGEADVASPLMYHHRRYVTVEDQPLPTSQGENP